jgi:hypothetical protein
MYVEAVEAAGDGLGSLCRDRRAFYHYHLHTSHISLFNDQTGQRAAETGSIWRRFWRPAGRPFPPPLDEAPLGLAKPVLFPSFPNFDPTISSSEPQLSSPPPALCFWKGAAQLGTLDDSGQNVF